MKCIIVEDQPPAQRLLKRYVEDIGSLELVAVFPDALQAMEFLKTEKVDVLLLDIHLPKLSGIEFLKVLAHPPQVVLTTAFPDYALESYDLDVVDYLLKPISFQRFVKAVAKLKTADSSARVGELVKPQPAEDFIFIKSGHALLKVVIQQIRYIKADGDYTEIHLPGKMHLSPEPLRFWLDKLTAHNFHQVHKSYLLNATHLEKIVGGKAYLDRGIVLPIGRAYKSSFLDSFISD
ncbi:MAG: response regulator [Bacteroidota bacterium]